MGELRMSGRERIRLDALGRVKRRELSVAAAAGLMGLSVRQARRVWKRFQHDGDAGLTHTLRGRAGNRRPDQASRDRIVKLHQERYPTSARRWRARSCWPRTAWRSAPTR